ncbi:unnamed protein product [Rotaria sp. Silwood1]|nr:unnamed protein product [Rotaria sp. Silwood1]CAF1305847.1 unnamed protein product [Rotaria sp. Silwood1]CAF3504323.1 unnamed protein product [Rotaria sp. Silwood1]CAF4632689.1 unnamed protein product [Rotaria sp. Silwood1]CAF4759713.1 unnamed protein product [Rotaria sp. Silwood1]
MPENDVVVTNGNDKKKCCFWTIRWYLLLLCLIVLCQSMITSGYIGSIVSSIENYYGFSTERLGIALSSYDIIGVLSIPLISYIGSQYNRAKIVALGAFLFSIGNILFALPYFINGYHKEIVDNTTNETSDYLCSQNLTNHSDDINLLSSNAIFNYLIPNSINNIISNNIIESQPTWTYYIIILSMIIMSIGASPFYTLGITFLTDHLGKDDQPIYTSILYGMGALGPAIGFIMGSLFISQWINIGDDKDLNGITKTDPQWIGRWWAGFILSSCLLTLFSIILFTFPSNLQQNNNQILESDESVRDHNQSSGENYQMRSLCQLSNIKEIFQSIIDLFKNLIYILSVLINSIENILVVSFTTFMVKYIESVFNISSSLSSILTGSIVVPAAVFGTITGGYLVRRFHMNIFQCIQLILISCFISLVALLSLIFIKCKSNIKYQSDSQCSQLCNCSPYIYQPVCFQQQITFFSPCYAGCTIVNGTEYSNCSCLSLGDQVLKGSCEKFCLIETFLFLLILFLVTYFETLMATPQLIIVLRSVQHELQSFSLGLQNCIMKVIAQIPTPILFGIIIDNQCLFWSESTWHRRGSCFVYDGNRLPFTLFGTAIIIKLISLTLIIILFLIALKRNKTQNICFSTEEQQDLLNNSHY